MIDFILRPFRRNIGKDKRYYRAVDDMFGFIAHNIELYKLALIHKSASVMYNGTQINNERLEYLGDAVLECVSSEYLYIEFPDKNEGFMTQLRSKMVSRQTLNEVAKRIGLDEYVITHSSNNLSQKHIYGDAFEAMVGAIYLDQGYEFVNRLLINHIFVKYIKVEELLVEETDFKSRLIEWCQKNHHQIQFKTENDRNYSSSHPFFYSKVLIDGMEVGYGAGDSKKEAEQRASHSVSVGFSEADYTKIMDRLDSIDGVSGRGGQRGDKRQAAKSEPKSKPEQKIEPKIEVVPKAEVKTSVAKSENSEQDVPIPTPKPTAPRKQRQPKAEPKTEPEIEAEGGADIADKPQPKSKSKSKPKTEKAETKADKSESKAESQTEPMPTPEKQTKKRTKKQTEKQTDKQAEKQTESKTETAETSAESEQKKPARRPRRRPQSKSESAKESATEAERVEIDSAV